MTPYQIADAIGLKKSAYYNKVNGLTEWSLPEVIKLTALNKGSIDIELNGELYRITAKKRNLADK